MILQDTLLYSMLEEGSEFFNSFGKIYSGIKVANLDLPEVCEEAKKNVSKQAS